jgi:hypothetical protein
MVQMTWSRNASNLGNTKAECSVADQLQQLWPTSEYPVHINIVGRTNKPGLDVKIWNGTNIEVMVQMYPEEYPDANAVVIAVLHKVEEVIDWLKEEQKL